MIRPVSLSALQLTSNLRPQAGLKGSIFPSRFCLLPFSFSEVTDAVLTTDIKKTTTGADKSFNLPVPLIAECISHILNLAVFTCRGGTARKTVYDLPLHEDGNKTVVLMAKILDLIDFFRKAFNTVDHFLHVRKLSCIGFDSVSC